MNEVPDLFKQTMRTIAVLVGACILFVGALSTAAVFITNRALGPTAKAAPAVDEGASASAKKPLSI